MRLLCVTDDSCVHFKDKEREKLELGSVLNESGVCVAAAAVRSSDGCSSSSSMLVEGGSLGLAAAAPHGTQTDLIGGAAGALRPVAYDPLTLLANTAGYDRYKTKDHDIIHRNNNNSTLVNLDQDECSPSLQCIISFTQSEGPWPVGHPLPLPTWGPVCRPPWYAATVWQYEELATNIELNVQHLLEEHNYNTVGNFLELYNKFRENKTQNLEEFFHGYEPHVTREHHTCVGLALELWWRLTKLENRFPGLTDCLYLVSCEEWIEALPEYVDLGDHLDMVADTLEKEHVMLALKVNVAGRAGVLLCDPGYHVARVITVMKDHAYPHTGWFTQSEEGNIQKEYNYSFSKLNSKYIEWSERETRNGIKKLQTSLVYVSRPYLTAVDVTERRNLVYDFRSLLSRDTKGHLIAGFYFKVKPEKENQEVTLFYQTKNSTRQRIKMKFDMFLRQGEITEEHQTLFRLCNQQLNLPENGLITTLRDLALVMSDKNFIEQLLTINENINTIAEVY